MSFLKVRGLELSRQKTRITHIEDGFNFLGFNIRKYKGKLLIKPSKESIKAIAAKIKTIINRNKSAKQENLILQLNPVIRGWANYYQHAVSTKAFSLIDYKIWHMLWKWARRRHPGKSLRRVKDKYFASQDTRKWVFSTGVIELTRMCGTPIRRHVKIRSDTNPYDTKDELYFEKRWMQSWKNQLPQKRKTLWINQCGWCSMCMQRLQLKEELHIHHRIKKSEGGNDSLKNLVLLHGTCHRQLHANAQKQSVSNKLSSVGTERCLI